MFAPSPFLALVLVTTARVVVGCTAKVPGDFKFVAVSIVCVVKCDAIVVATVVDSDDAAVVTAFAVVTDGDILVDFIVVVVGVATILAVLVVAFAICVAVL